MQLGLHLALKSAAKFIGIPSEFNPTDQQPRLNSLGLTTELHRHDNYDVVPACARGLKCR
jgi:hypothetical protein